MIYKPKVLNL